jgi:hypothetical protein
MPSDAVTVIPSFSCDELFYLGVGGFSGRPAEQNGATLEVPTTVAQSPNLLQRENHPFFREHTLEVPIVNRFVIQDNPVEVEEQRPNFCHFPYEGVVLKPP